MSNITENEAYLLGLLYGKGSIIQPDNDKDEVVLRFKVRYRRPTDGSLRSDNIHTVINNQRGYRSTLDSRLLYGFASIKRILKDEWNINADIDTPTSEHDNWILKEVSMTTDPIPRTFSRLTELLNTDKLSNKSLLKFPYHLRLEESRPLALSFIQGICDSCSLVPNEASDNHGGNGEGRIQLEPSQERWELPIGLCRLFQVGLNIPVNNINWGHPQIRGKWVWKFQNHQFRVSLKNIPPQMELYRLDYKREEYNNLYQRKGIVYERGKLCPSSKRIRKGETIYLGTSNEANLNSELLDERLRGIDINAKYKKAASICKLLGCKQCEDYFSVEIPDWWSDDEIVQEKEKVEN